MKNSEFLKLTKKELLGKTVSFPTDTVYGVGALLEDNEGIKKIYQMKNRDINKPLAILAPSIESILPYIEYPTVEVLDLMNKYWPGALTIIFNKNINSNLTVNPNFKTIAFRIPNSPVALEVLNKFGPLATTSVNISGSKPLNDYNIIVEHFDSEIDFIIEDYQPTSNVSSTIVDATKYPFVIIREGDVKIK